MSNLGSQIGYYLRIAIDINKKIGGTKAYEAEKKAKDKFSVLKQEISKKIHYIRITLESKPLSKGIASWDSDQDEQLRQKLRQVNSCIIRIKQSVQQQKSNTSTKQLKKQIIQKLQEQYRSYQQLIYDKNENGVSESGKLNQNNKFQTLTDMRANLLTDDLNSNNIYTNQRKKPHSSNHPTDIQMGKLQQWQKQNEQVDNHLDDVIQKTKTLKSGINQAGKLINQIDSKVKQLTTNVQNLTDDLVKSNKKLKGVVEKFRKPHKFCVDIILSVILIGLIVGIIKVSSG